MISVLWDITKGYPLHHDEHEGKHDDQDRAMMINENITQGGNISKSSVIVICMFSSWVTFNGGLNTQIISSLV